MAATREGMRRGSHVARGLGRDRGETQRLTILGGLRNDLRSRSDPLSSECSKDSARKAKFFSPHTHAAQTASSFIGENTPGENAALTAVLTLNPFGRPKGPLQCFRHHLLDCGPLSVCDDAKLSHRLWIEGVSWKCAPREFDNGLFFHRKNTYGAIPKGISRKSVKGIPQSFLQIDTRRFSSNNRGS
jgi:hypothetical protein